MINHGQKKRKIKHTQNLTRSRKWIKPFQIFRFRWEDNLEWIGRKYGVVLWTEIMWLRTGYSGGCSGQVILTAGFSLSSWVTISFSRRTLFRCVYRWVCLTLDWTLLDIYEIIEILWNCWIIKVLGQESALKKLLRVTREELLGFLWTQIPYSTARHAPDYKTEANCTCVESKWTVKD
jgi:hypothetical protein